MDVGMSNVPGAGVWLAENGCRYVAPGAGDHIKNCFSKRCCKKVRSHVMDAAI